MWYTIPHTKTKIINRTHVHTYVHTAQEHTGTRADFFGGMYQLETRFARITMNKGPSKRPTSSDISTPSLDLGVAIVVSVASALYK